MSEQLPNAPWRLTGSFMMESMRHEEVSTKDELVEAMTKLLELSPVSEVLVQDARFVEVQDV